ncbi:MAG: RdgB/HAM1 family non-canonical purine NTP pyrophosphatase [Vicinamibacterales bacterium]
MRQLLIATTNPGKLREIRSILEHLPVELLSLRDFPPVAEPEETGATFEANARLKALYYDSTVTAAAIVQFGPMYTVAEDSGLAIDALNGDPGVQSARFLRPDASYPERFDEIARRLAAVPSAPRTARFVAAVAVAHAASVIYETTGTVEGEIAAAPRGERGFGYDPILYYPSFGRTLAEATDEEKAAVGHRGQAFRQLAGWLESTERRTMGLSSVR